MLDSIRKGQTWLTWAFILVIGGVFVFFMGQGSSIRSTPSGNAIIELDGDRVEFNDYQRARAQQESVMAERFGPEFDARQLATFVDSQTLQSLISGTILAHAAREIGYRVSRQEVQAYVRDSGNFRGTDGRFDPDEFEAFARYEFGSQRNFVRVVRQDLLRQKMIRLLLSQARVSEGEARLAGLQTVEKVRLRFVSLDADRIAEDLELGEEELQVHLAAHGDEIRGLYETRQEEFTQEDRVRARHILIEVARDADTEAEESARTRAESVLERVRGGEPFEEVAEAVSDDPASAGQGGDLGIIARGESAPALESAIFAADANEILDLIRTDQGFHVVEVLEQVPGGVRPFEDVSTELAREHYLDLEGRRRTDELAAALSDAIRAGATLEEAAQAEMLPVQQSVELRRRPDGLMPGLGASKQAMAVAFALREDDPTSPRAFPVESTSSYQLVLIELADRIEPDEAELAQAADDARDRLLNQERSRIIDEWVTQRREELVAAGRLLINADLVLGS